MWTAAWEIGVIALISIPLAIIGLKHRKRKVIFLVFGIIFIIIIALCLLYFAALMLLLGGID
jgi:hypothetical protein